eukprot:2184467-Amphidinium_carterae.1
MCIRDSVIPPQKSIEVNLTCNCAVAWPPIQLRGIGDSLSELAAKVQHFNSIPSGSSAEKIAYNCDRNYSEL